MVDPDFDKHDEYVDSLSSEVDHNGSIGGRGLGDAVSVDD